MPLSPPDPEPELAVDDPKAYVVPLITAPDEPTRTVTPSMMAVEYIGAAAKICGGGVMVVDGRPMPLGPREMGVPA